MPTNGELMAEGEAAAAFLTNHPGPWLRFDDCRKDLKWLSDTAFHAGCKWQRAQQTREPSKKAINDSIAMDILRARKLNLIASKGRWDAIQTSSSCRDGGAKDGDYITSDDPADAAIAFNKEFQDLPPAPAKEESKAEKAMRIMREEKLDVRLRSVGDWFVQTNGRQGQSGIVESVTNKDGGLIVASTPEDAILAAYEFLKAKGASK